MKFAIIYRPKHPAPPGAMPEMLKAMGDWMQSHADRMENMQFFVGGGGFATIESDDAKVISALTASNPFTPYMDVEIKPLLEPAAAIAVLQEAYSQ